MLCEDDTRPHNDAAYVRYDARQETQATNVGGLFSYLELESFLTCICFGCFSLLLWQAQDIFDSPAEATQYTPGWAKVVAVGQVRCFGVLPCRRQN